MEDSVGDRYLKRLYQRRLNLIDGYISSYYSIINSTKRLRVIKKENDLASVLCDIESDCLGAKDDRKKREVDTEDHRKQKSEKTRIGRTTRGSKVLIFVKFWFFRF